MYIIPSDYNFQARSEIKNFLGGQDNASLLQAEMAALSQVKSYLSTRYDTDAIFPDITEFEYALFYSENEYVFFKGENDEESKYRIYRCTDEVTNGEDPTNTDYWKREDPRHALVLMYTIDITLYHLYAAFSRSNVPAHREKRFDDAIEWLGMVSEASIEADLPQKSLEGDSTSFHRLRWGSNRKECHRY